MNEIKPKEVLQERTLKLSHGIIYGIGCGIGGSIFVLLGVGIDIAGSGLILSLLLGGILIFFTGLNYAELSTSLPIAGGAYNFSKEGLGGFLAFIIGFFLWIANIATCAFSAQIFAAVFNEVFTKFNLPISDIIVTIISILPILLTSIIIFRTQKTAIKTLLLFTFVLISLFAFFIISGLLISPFTNPNFILPPIKLEGIIPGFLLLFILFTSITSNIAYLNPELKNPSKNIPKTIIYAIIITLIIYLSITFVVLLDIGGNPADLIDNPVLLADVFESVIGPFGFYFMVFAAIISTLIAINAAMGSAVSVITALARDRFVHEKIRETKKKSDLPTLGLVITVVFVLLFTIFAGIGLTAEIINFIYFFALAFVNYAAVKLRRKRKELDRPFKAPFFPGLPIFLFICFLAFAVILGIIISIAALVLGLIILVIGFTYHLLAITDKPSINLTLTGIKFFFSIIIGLFVWAINNYSVTNLNLIIINRILIIVSVFILITVILDLLPLRELAYYYVKFVDKEKVAINIGNAQIIDLGKKRSNIIHNINLIITVLQFISSVVIFSIVFMFVNNSISVQEIIVNIGPSITNIPSLAGTTLFTSILFIFGTILFICGILSWYRNKEIKLLGL
ncbi:MAG: amino acid permease [Candidatus Lokiarchaeota archaeon]|nr:amino acid permease [Candidatus Lokiarchaeota archaeon]